MGLKRHTERLRQRLLGLSRGHKRAITMFADMMVLPLAVWLAFYLRLGEPLHLFFTLHWWLVLAIPLIGIACFAISGLYNMVARYIGPRAIYDVFRAAALTTLAFVAVVEILRLEPFPRSVYPIFLGVVFLFNGGMRLLARSWFQSFLNKPRGRQPVAIYGAGRAGAQLANTLVADGEFHAHLFVDDDPRLQGQVIGGLKVYAPDDLPALIDRCEIHHVLLAMPSAPRSRRQAIVKSLEPLALHVKTLPDMADIVAGRARVEQIQDIDVDDLLGRGTVTSDDELVSVVLTGRSVMITGAGGSIGSELARQTLAREPARLVLFDHSEFLLYRIDRDLRKAAASAEQDVEIVALLGSVIDQTRIEAIFRGYEIEVLYHAAAYKHVPLVETNALEGIRNNVLATRCVAEAACNAGVRDMVLVSTDKAVHPHNVMGATKRLAELTLQSLANARRSPTRFAIVRFGNVLNSSGSVVPLFRDQIRHGGPVTVTDPDVTRYFMSIREASALVIQAGAMAEGGEVFVLDMGEPVQILELARRMIRLSGFSVRSEDNPDGDIAIDFIGLRPGEKLHEDLFYGAKIRSTEHPMIMQTVEPSVGWASLQVQLDALQMAVDAFDSRQAVRLLCEATRNLSTDTEAHGRLVQPLASSPLEVEPLKSPQRPH